MILLTGCVGVGSDSPSSVCPRVIEYSRSEQQPEHIEVGAVRVISGGVPAALCGKVLRRGSAEGLHEGSKAADQGVHSVDVVAARGALRPPPCVDRKVRDARVLRDPLVGDEPVCTEYRIGRHHGQ